MTKMMMACTRLCQEEGYQLALVPRDMCNIMSRQRDWTLSDTVFDLVEYFSVACDTHNVNILV